MKKYYLTVIGIVISLLALSQEDEFKTVFQKSGEKELKISGFGGTITTFGAIGSDFVLMMGGGGGLMLNNFFIGGYGVGRSNEIIYKEDPEYNLGYGHGGLWMGYTIKPSKAVHASVSGQMGLGNISRNIKIEDDNNEKISSKPIMVFTPILEVELNMSKYMKIGGGVLCTFLTGKGISQTPYTVQDFAIPGFFLSTKFGWFD